MFLLRLCLHVCDDLSVLSLSLSVDFPPLLPVIRSMSSATFTWGRNLEKLRHQIFKVLRSKSHLAKKEMCLSLKIKAFRSLGWFHSFAIECWYQGFKASVRPIYTKRHFIYGSGIWSCRQLWFYLQGFIDIHCKMYASIQWFIGRGERGETMRLSVFGSKDEKKSYCLIKKKT